MARGIYLNLPEDVPLWLLRETFVDNDPARLGDILS